MRIGILTVDAREFLGRVAGNEPVWGSAVAALLEGFECLDGEGSLTDEIEVFSFAPVQKPVVVQRSQHVRFWSYPIPHFAGARWGYFGRIAAIRRWTRENRIQLLHAQGTERWCAWAAANIGVPFVLTIHGHIQTLMRAVPMVPRTYWLLHAWFERIAIPRASGVICLSRFVQDAVAGRARNTWLIPNAASKRFFAISPQPASPPVVLQIGEFLPGKRPLELLEALDAIRGEVEFEIIFLGWKPPGSEYAARFEEAVSQRLWCRIIPAGSAEIVADWLRKTSVLVHPSIMENCPMVILEAMAAGVPVVATSVGGIPDVIESGMGGLLVPTNEMRGLADGVQKLLTDAKLRQTLSINASERAKEAHFPPTVSSRTLDAYRKAFLNAE
ncbi:MAG: glycosyltransferase family 4 protein [bacterium]